MKLKKKFFFTDHGHDKYITTPEFNNSRKICCKTSTSKFDKADFDAKLPSLNRKITSNKTKHLLVENELKKLNSFNLSYFIRKSHFDEDAGQNYLVFQPIMKYFTLNGNWITKWKSKGSSNKSLEVFPTTTNTLTPSVNYYGDKVRLRLT